MVPADEAGNRQAEKDGPDEIHQKPRVGALSALGQARRYQRSVALPGDIVTLIRGDASTLDVIAMPRPDGVYVSDLAAESRTVPPHPDLASRLAATQPQEAA